MYKLRSRNQQLVNQSEDATAKCVLLEHQLEDANTRHAALEKKYLDEFQDKLGSGTASPEGIVAADRVARLEQLLDRHKDQLCNYSRLNPAVSASSTPLSTIATELKQTNVQSSSNSSHREDQDSRLESQIGNLVEVISDASEQLISQDKVNEMLSAEIKALQAQLEQTKKLPQTSDGDAPELRKELDILRRENRLMATAYYDLASRLQMNSVTLQRRAEPPRSWLNIHRRQVDVATAVRR